jgi:isobutyryl-CoA mutase
LKSLSSAEAPAILQRLQQAVMANDHAFAVLMDAVRCSSPGQITNVLLEVGSSTGAACRRR